MEVVLAVQGTEKRCQFALINCYVNYFKIFIPGDLHPRGGKQEPPVPAPGLQQVRPPSPRHRQHHRHWHRHRGCAQDQWQGESLSPGTRQGQDTRSWDRSFISCSGTFIKSLAHKSARTNCNQLKTLLTSPGLDNFRKHLPLDCRLSALSCENGKWRIWNMTCNIVY